MTSQLLLRRLAGSGTFGTILRQQSGGSAAGQVAGKLPRPARMRDRALHYAGKGIIQGGVITLLGGTVAWILLVEPYRRAYLEYYRTADPEKIYFHQKQAGVFQSVRPMKPDNPRYWMGTYRGSEGSESKDEFLALIKRFPELEIKVLSK